MVWNMPLTWAEHRPQVSHWSEGSILLHVKYVMSVPPLCSAQRGVCWKMRVRDAVLERRQVERNWKERVCGISDHQPDNTGVLCAVDSCQQYLLAWYVLHWKELQYCLQPLVSYALSPATHREQCTPGMCVMNVDR